MQMPQFLLRRFGVVGIVSKSRNRIRPEELVQAYEFEFYTEDYAGGTLTDGTFFSARKQYYALYRPGQRQQLVAPYKCYFLNIETNDPELTEWLNSIPQTGLIWNMDAVVEVMREMLEVRGRHMLEDRLRLQSCVCQILAILASQLMVGESMEQGAALHRKELVEVERYIRNNLAEELSLKRLAEFCRMDPTHFHKMYTSVYGQTPAQRIWAYRLRAAKVMLSQGEVSVGDIAMQCGFSSQAYFASKFKQNTGMTPTTYRRKILETPKK